MSTAKVNSIYSDINDYMGKFDLPPSSWYVGITNDIDRRLFTEHNVSKSGTTGWIYRMADNHQEARDIEIAYHKYGCQGSHGGGDHTAVYVYAYVVTANTVE